MGDLSFPLRAFLPNRAAQFLLAGTIAFLAVASAVASPWLLASALPLALLWLFAVGWAQARRLRRRGEGLGPLQRVTNPLGIPYMLRGRVGGRPVRVFRDRVEVTLEPPKTAELPRLVLERLLADGTPSAWSESDAARAALGRLLARGVEHLAIREERVVVHGGEAPARELVEDAVRVALAPARVRVAGAAAPQGCPFCHQPIGALREASTFRCPDCETLHHGECWSEHGGCSVFSCKRAPGPGRARERAGA